MVSFYLSTSSDGNINVCRRNYDLFGEVIELMGWFPLSNLEKAKAFKVYLDNNPDGNLNDFFSIKMYEDKK